MGEESINGGIIKAELRKNLLRSVVNICNESEKKVYTEQFQVALTNSSLELLEHMISKLTDISSHANSKKIRIKDILLYFRSHPVMMKLDNSDYSDYCPHLYCYLYNILANVPSGLLQLSVLKGLLNDPDSDDSSSNILEYDGEEDSD